MKNVKQVEKKKRNRREEENKDVGLLGVVHMHDLKKKSWGLQIASKSSALICVGGLNSPLIKFALCLEIFTKL